MRVCSLLPLVEHSSPPMTILVLVQQLFLAPVQHGGLFLFILSAKLPAYVIICRNCWIAQRGEINPV